MTWRWAVVAFLAVSKVLILVGCDSSEDGGLDARCEPNRADAGSIFDSGPDSSDGARDPADLEKADGSPAADADNSSPASCDEPSCCLDNGYCIETIPEGATLVITSADSLPELPADLSAIGGAVDVVLEGMWTGSAVITLQLPEDIDPSAVIVWFVAEGESKGASAAIEVMAGTVSISVRQSGTYVATQIVITPPCDEMVLTGDFSAQSDSDLEQLVGVTKLNGSLSIEGDVADLAALACLTVIEGGVSVNGASALQELELPALAKIESRILVTNAPLLTAVRLPSLRRVGSYGAASLVLDVLPRLTAVDLRNLVETPGSIVMSVAGYTLDGVVRADRPLTLNFASLTTVHGALELTELVTLKDMGNFSNLAVVEGDLRVTSVPYLADFDGFDALEQVGGSVEVRDGSELRRVELGSLTSVGSSIGVSLRLADLPRLTDVDVHSLRETPEGGTISIARAGSMVTGDLTLNFGSLTTVRGELELSSLANLKDVDGLSSLRAIDRGLRVTGCAKLVTLNFGALEQVGRGISVTSNAALQSIDLHALTSLGHACSCVAPESCCYGFNGLLLDVLPDLIEVDISSLAETPEEGGSVQIKGAGSNAEGALTLNFAALTTVHGHLELSSVANLENVDGFSNLRVVEGNLSVTSDGQLIDLHGFAALEQVKGNVVIASDAALKSIDLRSLASVGGYASVLLDELPELIEVDFRSLVETVRLGDGISISNAGSMADGPLTLNFSSLTTLNGKLHLASLANLAVVKFASLSTLPGSLELSSLSNLESVSLPLLTRLGSHLTLQSLPKLTNVAGFGELDRIGGMLTISSNAALTSLDGFGSLTGLGSSLTITDNAALPTCEAKQLLEQLAAGGFSRSSTISGNLADSCGQ